MKEESSISFWVVFFLHFLRFLVLFLSGRTLQLGELLDCIFWIFFHLPRVRNIRKVVFGGSSWDKKPNFSNLYQIKVLMTSSPSIMRTFIFNICGKIIMEKYQRKWDERGLTFFGAAGDVFRSWLRTFEDIGEWVRTPQKIHDCPLRVRAKQTQRSPFCPISEMESFAPFFGSWLAAAALQWKSQNRRKCDGKGSNLQHLKDNWPAAALLGKSIVKCWMSQKREREHRLPAPMKFLRPDFKISRLSPRGRQKQTQNEKRSHFLASYCKQHLALAMTWKRKSGKWKPLWKAEGGEVFCFSLPQCSTPQSNHQQLQQKKRKEKNYLTMQSQGVLDFLIRIRRKLVKDISLTSFLLILLILDMTFPNHPFEKTFAVDSLLLSHLLKHFPFSVHCCTINLWWQS